MGGYHGKEMGIMQWLAIGVGAAFGACLRAWLSRFNTGQYAFGGYQLGAHWLPLGTLVANLLGGFLIGLALVIFERFGSHLPETLRLFVVTGFLGGLTTFSSFSAEVFALLNSGRLIAGLLLIALHVFLTLLATAVGYYVLKAVI